MNRRLKVVATLACLAVVLVMGLAVPVASWAQTANAVPKSAPIYTQVIIPGSAVENTAEGLRGRVVDVAQYIGLLYNFLLGIIGVVAGVMIMVGGFTYLTAGGDKSKVDEAKKRIQNAVAGIVLAYTAWLLLNTINPDLVNLKAPRVGVITKQIVPFGGYKPMVWPEGLCSTDADCASKGKDYFCAHTKPSGPGKQDGQCALKALNRPDGEICTSNEGCAKGRCLKESPSKDGVCSSGGEGTFCYQAHTNDDCTAPRKCVDAGGGAAYCSMGLKGSFCSKTSDCITADLVCKTVGGVGRCSSPTGAAEGEPCVQNTDCAGSDVPVSSATADKPTVFCLKPPSDANTSCKVGGDYANKGTECFCHVIAPEEAKSVGLYCFKDADCYRGTKPPQLRCKLESGKAYGQCAQ